MSVKPNAPTRGRPKTLERDHVLQVALMCYWAEGPTDVPISNDIIEDILRTAFSALR